MKKLIIGTIVLMINISPLGIGKAYARSTKAIGKAYARSTHPNFNWVDVKDHIGFCESKGNYNARNRRSTASGKYQFLNSTWAGRYGVKSAYLASPDQQEQAALELHAARGLQPWRSSRRCWEQRVRRA